MVRIYSYHVFLFSIVSLFFLGFFTSKFLLQEKDIYGNVAYFLQRRDTETDKRVYSVGKKAELDVSLEIDVSRDNAISGTSQPYLNLIDKEKIDEVDLDINEETAKQIEEDENEDRELVMRKRKSRYERLSCQPTDNVAFLKTHKTGSSTLTNILNRYADLRDLRIALPSLEKYRFGWPVKFHWRHMDILRAHGKSVHILSNHARYERSKMDIVMREGTKYITILRDPVSHFESTFHYMEFALLLNLTWSKNPMEAFLEDPFNILRLKRTSHDSLSLIRNGMFFDLGLEKADFDNLDYISERIQLLKEEFDLVLIMEYFDESLVLMMREFCWDFDDILYFKQNERVEKRKELSDYMKFRVRAWNMADVLLYEFFNKTFWDRINSHGEDFYDDLEEFRQLNTQLREECISNKVMEEQAFQLMTSRVKAFALNPYAPASHRYFCSKMLRNEIDYIEYFRIKLNPYGAYFRQMEEEGRIKNETFDLYSKIKKDHKEESRLRLQKLNALRNNYNRVATMQGNINQRTNPIRQKSQFVDMNERVRIIRQQIIATERHKKVFKKEREIIVGDLVSTPESEKKNVLNQAPNMKYLENYPTAYRNQILKELNSKRTDNKKLNTGLAQEASRIVAGNRQSQNTIGDKQSVLDFNRDALQPENRKTFEEKSKKFLSSHLRTTSHPIIGPHSETFAYEIKTTGKIEDT